MHCEACSRNPMLPDPRPDSRSPRNGPAAKPSRQPHARCRAIGRHLAPGLLEGGGKVSSSPQNLAVDFFTALLPKMVASTVLKVLKWTSLLFCYQRWCRPLSSNAYNRIFTVLLLKMAPCRAHFSSHLLSRSFAVVRGAWIRQRQVRPGFVQA